MAGCTDQGNVSTWQQRIILERVLFLSLLSFLTVSCKVSDPGEYRETREQMGTLVSITVIDENGPSAAAAAFDEIERVESLMSTYIEHSEISRLNREGTVEASPDCLRVLERAGYFNRLSGGAFDITMKPLLDLYGASFDSTDQPPSAAAIEKALTLVSGGRMKIEGNTVKLAEGSSITLDGIAKGYAIDRAVAVLMEHGVEHALVDAGGDVRVVGDKCGSPWKVAMQDPRDPANHLAVIRLDNNSVATSGDYRRYFEPSMKHHHIIDPRTGYSAGELISVSVVAETAMDADALATSIFVMGAARGMALAESLEGVEALVVTSDREIIHTAGMPID